MIPTALILRTAGTNCDAELAHAFELAGARAETVHLNELIADPRRLEQCDLLGFPGGFSYGDDIAAGRIFASRLQHRLFEPLMAAINRGVGVIGICNGFQVLVKLGLLPDPQMGQQTLSLTHNTSGRFVDRWGTLRVDPDSPCLWTRGLPGSIDLPVAHGEGRLTGSAQELNRLGEHRQIPLHYAPNDNPNGSVADIAGICDTTGRVLGLMPHPERHVSASQHPAWTRHDAIPPEPPAGLRFFQNAVEQVIPSPA